MNEQNVTVEITAEVKINGVVNPNATVEIESVVIGEIVIPTVKTE